MRRALLWACLSIAMLGMAAPIPEAAAAKADKKPKKETHGIITWNVKPETVIIYLDGKKLGTADRVKPSKVKPGQHLVRLVWNKDEVEEPFAIAAGENKEFQYTLEDSGAGKQKQPQPDAEP